MKLMYGFVTWVIVLALEVFWLYYDFVTPGSWEDLIYVVMVITLIVGITGLHVFKSTNQKG